MKFLDLIMETKVLVSDSSNVQCATTDMYSGGLMGDLVFENINFADGRIKGYGTNFMGQEKLFNYLLVRGSSNYGINDFIDNGDGTISDAATGLMWMKKDNAQGVIWSGALSYARIMNTQDILIGACLMLKNYKVF